MLLLYLKILVDCLDGICKKTYGYVKGNGHVFKFVEGTNNGKADDGDVMNSSDCNTAIGKYHGANASGADGFYVKSGTAITFISDSSIKHIILRRTGSGTLFHNSNDDILVKHGVNYSIIDKFDSGNL